MPFAFTSSARSTKLPTVFPSWYPAAGAVVEINSGTTIGSAARADGANSYAGSDPDDIVEPWCGGALIYIGGQPYLAVMGGGHGDSAYNGIVKFGPLFGAGSDSPTWTMFKSGSGTGNVQNGPTYADGRQAAVHTYNNIVGVGATIYAMATDGYYSAGSNSANAYSITAGGQSTLTSNPRGVFGPAENGACGYYGGKIYYRGGNSQFDYLHAYDVGGNSWSNEGANELAFANYVALAIDTTRGALFATDGTAGAYWTLPSMTQSAGKNAPTSFESAVVYDPGRDRFVSYVDNSLDVRELDAASLASGGNPSWTTRTFTGSAPVATVAAGMFGRFQYVPELAGFIEVPGLESSVYFRRST